MTPTPESFSEISESQRREQILSSLYYDAAILLRSPINIKKQPPLIKRGVKRFLSSPYFSTYEMALPQDTLDTHIEVSWEGQYDSTITLENPNTLGFTRIQFNSVAVISANEKPQQANLAINFRKTSRKLTLDRGNLPLTITDQEVESSLRKHIDEVKSKVQSA